MVRVYQATGTPPYASLHVAEVDDESADEWSQSALDLRTRVATPEEVAERLRTSRATVYALLARGELRSIQIGRSRRVVLGDLAAYLDRLRTSDE